MSDDIHYLAEKYLLELMSAGAHLRKREQNEEAENPERYNVPDELDNFILRRGKTYFYGHHPKTGELKWTYDVRLAHVMLGNDADKIISQTTAIEFQKLPARAEKEASF